MEPSFLTKYTHRKAKAHLEQKKRNQKTQIKLEYARSWCVS